VDEVAHVLRAMAEQVEVVGQAVREESAAQGSTAGQVAGHPALAGSNEFERGIRNYPSIEGLTQGALPEGAR
jgi:hypothetical protein